MQCGHRTYDFCLRSKTRRSLGIDEEFKVGKSCRSELAANVDLRTMVTRPLVARSVDRPTGRVTVCRPLVGNDGHKVDGVLLK